MNIRSSLVPNFKSAKAIEPTEGSFNLPTVRSKITVSLTTFFNHRLNSSAPKFRTKRFRIICFVTLKCIRPLTRTAFWALNGRNGFDGWKSFFHVVNVGCAQTDNNRNSLRICDKVAFSPCLSTVGRIRAGLRPPFGAAMLEESIRNRFQSIWFSLLSSFKKVLWIFSQIPSLCHFSKRLHAVISEPQPISCGRYSHGMPVFKTKTMAVNTCRLEMAGRPFAPFGLSGGSNDFILFHNSSSTIVRAIRNLRVPYGYRIKLRFC